MGKRLLLEAAAASQQQLHQLLGQYERLERQDAIDAILGRRVIELSNCNQQRLKLPNLPQRV